MWADFDPYTNRVGRSLRDVDGRGAGPEDRGEHRLLRHRLPLQHRARVDRAGPGDLQGVRRHLAGRSSSAKGAVAAGVVNNPSGSTASRSVRTHFGWSLK